MAANNFEFKLKFVWIVLHSVKFQSIPNENPNKHIKNCLEACDMLKIKGVSDDAIRFHLFPFSLEGRAKQ